MSIFSYKMYNILIQNGATDRRLVLHISRKQPQCFLRTIGGCFCLCSYVLRLHVCGLIVRSSPQSFQLLILWPKVHNYVFSVIMSSDLWLFYDFFVHKLMPIMTKNASFGTFSHNGRLPVFSVVWCHHVRTQIIENGGNIWQNLQIYIRSFPLYPETNVWINSGKIISCIKNTMP